MASRRRALVGMGAVGHGPTRPARRTRSTVAAWVRKLDPDKRTSELNYLKDSIKLLRRYYGGFTASDGFSLPDVKALPKQSADRIREKAQTLRDIQSRPFIDYRPRSKKSREVIRLHTGQHNARQKVFPIHKPLGKTALAEHVKIRGRKLEFQSTYKDSAGKEHLRTEKHYFFILPKKVRTWEDIRTQMAKLVRSIPDGRYMILSNLYGPVGGSMNREDIMMNIERWFMNYSGMPDKEGMAETLIGVRYIAKDHEQAQPYMSLAAKQTEHFMKVQKARKERERRARKKQRK
ncbi:MAG: hypothetical protein ACRD33_00005 [Candidatus Acidiferrales bacterium]